MVGNSNGYARIKKLAERCLQFFEKKDDRFFLKKSAPDWLVDIVYKAHEGMLPDNYKYEFVFRALSAISDNDDEDSARYSLEPDIYTSELTDWLNSNPSFRMWYLDEVLQSTTVRNGFELLQLAQLAEMSNVFDIVFDSLQDFTEVNKIR